MSTVLSRATDAGAQHTDEQDKGRSKSTGRARKAYLHHLDLIRATTFSLVIFVHCLTQTTDEWDSVGVNSTSLLLHFTRNTFFALSGFVLMYQNFDKSDFSAWSFWRRRIKLVIFPYLAWSLIYWVIEDMWAHGRLTEVPSSLDEFGKLAMWGLSGFQMYFLFVMLQIYLLFPLVLWLVRATAGHHRLLMAVSVVAQFATFVTITHWQPPAGFAEYWWHYYATFVPYQFFILFGAVAAVHREEITAWLSGKFWWLATALVGTGALAVGTYLWRVWSDGQRPIYAAAAFQPTLLPFLVVAVTCLYAAALYWAQNWRDFTPRFARAVAFASNRSFGVFLVHVLVLFFILYPKTDGQPTILAALGQPWGTITVYLATLAGSLLLVEILRHLPGSLYLTGRPRLPIDAGRRVRQWRRGRTERAEQTERGERISA
ncbi:acyltransferase [Gordonia desulfuricans]|uniref:Acyltransferase n=1 Tax=Gordonia desulfuricans TaxID=89051 RepID=A0A7K3LIU1_9ACTN|nr:acyltransferase [Gordonia desulfuricans]NDK88186.1 acyltransferase [Gordonia desulfuricans]